MISNPRAGRRSRNGPKNSMRAAFARRMPPPNPSAAPRNGSSRRRARACRCWWSRRSRRQQAHSMRRRPRPRASSRRSSASSPPGASRRFTRNSIASRTSFRAARARDGGRSRSCRRVVRSGPPRHLRAGSDAVHDPTAASILAERQQEFEHFTAGAMRNLEDDASASVNRFHAQMASHVDASVGEGRNALASEFASMVERFRADREAYKSEWAAGLDQLSAEAAAKHQERLQATSDSWVVSSVRRLNEHGQSAVESLIRSADKSLRDSCSKVFEDLAEMLRQHEIDGRCGRVRSAAGIRRSGDPLRRTSSRLPAIRIRLAYAAGCPNSDPAFVLLPTFLPPLRGPNAPRTRSVPALIPDAAEG